MLSVPAPNLKGCIMQDIIGCQGWRRLHMSLLIASADTFNEIMLIIVDLFYVECWKVRLQDIIMQVDSLIVQQWEISKGILWELNQMVNAGVATVIQCSKAGQGAKTYENQLKKSIERKRKKVSWANSRLRKLASELKCRRDKQKMSRR